VEGQQLSLFPDSAAGSGRYGRLRRELCDPHQIWVDVADVPPPSDPPNFIDLFSGAGGMTLGFENAGYRAVASAEIDPVASATHERNFPNCRHFCGDVASFDPRLWTAGAGPIHLVVGGPPCQGFSVAGNNDPDDPRNYLFTQFVRVVDELQPAYVVMENVPRIATVGGGAFVRRIREAFADIGYGNVSLAILESADYGVAQFRPRAIFVANRLGLKNPYPSPLLTPDRHKSIESAISDLQGRDRDPAIRHEWTRHSPEFVERISRVEPGKSLYRSYADAYKRQYPGRPSMTVKENHGGTHIHPHLNRTISVREMARLQSFPDSFAFEGTMKKAMWQVGNAVPPRLAECVGKALLKVMRNFDIPTDR